MIGMEELVRDAAELPFEVFFAVLIFGMLRTFGLTYSFVAFGWGFGQGPTLRIGLAFVVGLPIMVTSYVEIGEMVISRSAMEITLLAAKEFAVGFGLGLLASGPFRAMQYAGAIVDGFRGEADSGIQAPDGSPLQTMSLLYLVIGFSAFFAVGGLWVLVANIYKTFEIWPVTEPLPALYEGSALIALEALNYALMLGLVIIAPLMILLVAVEVVLMIAVKLARRFGIYDLSFLIKNLLTLLTLPLMAMVVLRAADTHVLDVFTTVDTMREFFDE